MLRACDDHQVAAITMGDLNLHSWMATEKGVPDACLEEEQLWEPSNNQEPACATGKVTDGVWLALGQYIPDGFSAAGCGIRG